MYAISDLSILTAVWPVPASEPSVQLWLQLSPMFVALFVAQLDLNEGEQ